MVRIAVAMMLSLLAIACIEQPAMAALSPSGDFDGADFVVWQTNFPAENSHNQETGDADGDGDVDGADFAAWQGGFSSSEIDPSLIPEPNSIVLTVFSIIAAAALKWDGRRKYAQ